MENSLQVIVKRKQLLQSLGLTLSFVVMPSFAQRIASSPVAVDRIKALLQTPENQIDFAKAKLTIDQIIDPKTDIPGVMQKLDTMATQVKAMLATTGQASSVDKVEALVAYLYKPSGWNNQQIFKYDLENDPTGTQIFGNKLLANYLQSRRGNCISMPILFAILGQKIGLDVTLSAAPSHVFVKFRDELGGFQNVEATTGGPKKNASYQRDFSITQQAIDNDIYLANFTKKQAVVLMTSTLLEYYSNKKDSIRIHALADVLLEHAPKAADVMIFKGCAYAYAIEKEFKTRYVRYEDIPVELRPQVNELSKQNRYWYNKAMALGWREETEESKKAYLQMVSRAKQSQ
jgi:regulator of sirC expression with transglutaminase-like and TPR domain